VKPDVKAPILGQLENPSLLTNPDPEKYLDHNKSKNSYVYSGIT
jgi:hypothetical protein